MAAPGGADGSPAAGPGRPATGEVPPGQDASDQDGSAGPADPRPFRRLDGDWSFTAPDGGRRTVVLPHRWEDEDPAAVGTGGYERDLELSAADCAGPLVLDLGEGRVLAEDDPAVTGGSGYRVRYGAPVREVAEVSLDGQHLGTLWAPPYRVDLPDGLEPGLHRLRIALSGTTAPAVAADPHAARTVAAAHAAHRPLDEVYPVVFIDAIVVKVRDGQVTNKPFYVAIGVTVHGERDILGIWAGDGGEGAKSWLNVLTEIKNRGVADVLMLVCDGLKGLPVAVNTVWDKTVVQTCVIHLLRNTFRYAARQDWDRIATDLRPIYTAVNEPVAKERFAEFAATWRSKYPAAVALWERAWSEFVPFLDYDVEIRKIIATTTSIESLNARYRRESGPGATSRPTRPPSTACTWSPGHWTPPAAARHDGSSDGRQRSTRSPSPSKGASAPRTTRTPDASYTGNRTDPPPGGVRIGHLGYREGLGRQHRRHQQLERGGEVELAALCARADQLAPRRILLADEDFHGSLR